MSIVSLALAKRKEQRNNKKVALSVAKRHHRMQSFAKTKEVKKFEKEMCVIEKKFKRIKVSKENAKSCHVPPMYNQRNEPFVQTPFAKFILSKSGNKCEIVLVCGMIPSPYDGDPEIGRVDPDWGISYLIDGMYYEQEDGYERIAEIIAEAT